MKGIRVWPAGLIVGLALARLGRIWVRSEGIRQDKVVSSLETAVVTVLLLLVWLAVLSRLPWRARLRALLAVFLVLGTAATLFRVRGVTGDVVPILGWRWARAVEEHPVVPMPPAPAPAADGGGPTAGAAVPTPAPVPAAGKTTAAPPPAVPRAVSVTTGERDYPQFLGPGRNATLSGLRLGHDWTARPPRRLWKQPIGAGWSAFALSGRFAVTQEQRAADELVVGYELGTGEVRWRHADKARFESVIAGEGPRATPTIHGGRVYALGSTGVLNALDLATGAALWSRKVFEENGAERPQWGASGSPLVLGDLVIVSAGGAAGKSLVAYDRESGKPAWTGGSDRAGYASPALAEIAGEKQVLVFNHGSVAAHDPATGAVLWEQPWPAEQPNVAQPLPLPGDRVLVSAGYGVGSKLFQVSRGEDGRLTASLAWESPRLKAKFTNLVFHDGYVYGLDDGVLVCLDPATGERKWRAGRYGHGQVILADDVLLVQTEDGEIVLVRPNPASLTELARFPALEGKTWNPPALAGALLVVRNDREAAAYELPLEGE